MGIFTGMSKDTPGAVRITPFTEENEVVTLYPTIECTRYTTFKNEHPLKGKFSAKEFEKKVVEVEQAELVEPVDYTKLDAHVVCEGDKYYIPEYNEVEAILDHKRHGMDETEYLTVWNGLSRWFFENQLCECMDLVLEYEGIAANYEEIGAYMAITCSDNEHLLFQFGDTMDGAYGAECPIDVWMAPENRDKSVEAMHKEKSAMLKNR